MTDEARATTVRLAGLQGTNPLAFFAALGVVDALSRTSAPTSLSWTREAVPCAQIATVLDPDEIVAALDEDRIQWADAWALESADTLKFDADDLPMFLRRVLDEPDGRSESLALALVTEGVVDGKGNAKPTDFDFTAGQQKFSVTAREVRDGCSADDIERCLFETWTYPSKLKSFGWDVIDDRIYALSAKNPATPSESKRSEPGAEWLALLGLSLFPVVTTNGERTNTPGCAGSWKRGTFTWPLWSPPLSRKSIESLLQSKLDGDGAEQLLALGVHTLLRSNVRRSDQGGYGTFGPPAAVWHRPREASRPVDPFDDSPTR